ncbi:MAG TPA: hypothetical protein PKO06_15455 [Candidatus Ozemobacteraceae bacterium]|nr:hypothetical protein [Candidatus Ozemobacteraceae bacterium]
MYIRTIALIFALSAVCLVPGFGQTPDSGRESQLQQTLVQMWVDGPTAAHEKQLKELASGSDSIAARALVQLGCLARMKGDATLEAETLKKLEGFKEQKGELEGLSRLLAPAGQKRVMKVDLRDVLIPEAMRIIARSADRAVIVHGEIPEKKISLFLPEVEFDKVMQILADMGSCKIEKLDNLLVVSPKDFAASTTADTADNLISLDLKDVSIRDAMRLVAKRADINLVLHRSIGGVVTVQLKAVKPLDALRMLAKANDLHLEEDGSYLFVVPREKMYDVIGRSDMRTVKLNHLPAEKALEIVQQQTTCNGEVAGDRRLHLRGNPDVLDRAAKILSELDKPAKPFTTDFRIWESVDGTRLKADEFLALPEEKKLAVARIIARPRIITLPGSPAKISINSDSDDTDKNARFHKINLTADLLPLPDGMVRFKTGFFIELKSKDAKGIKETKRQGESTYVVKPGATFGQDLETENGTVLIEYTVRQAE